MTNIIKINERTTIELDGNVVILHKQSALGEPKMVILTKSEIEAIVAVLN